MKIIILLLSLLFFANCNNEKLSNFNYTSSIFIDVKINDSVTGKFILDTGASLTLLDSQFVKKNNISLFRIGNIDLGGTGNSPAKSVPIYQNIKTMFLNNNFSSEFLTTYDLKKIIPIEDGIAGINFFKNKIVKIDYKNEILTFLENNKEIDNSYTKIPLTLIKTKPYMLLHIKINDSISISGQFLIDTGSEFAVTLNSYYSEKLKLYEKIDKKIIKKVTNGGIGGNTYKFLIKADKIKFYGFKIQDILISCVKQEFEHIEKTKQILGRVGNLFLENFDVIFDINNKFMYLKPNENYKEFNYFRGGMSIGKKTKNGFTIRNVLEKSNARNIGIEKGDILTEIDGKNVIKLGYLKLKVLLMQKGKHKLKLLRNNKIIHKEIEITNLMKLL